MAEKRKAKKTQGSKKLNPEKLTTQETVSPSKNFSIKNFYQARKNRLITLVVILLIVLAVLIYKKPGLFVAALVNGKPVTQVELVNEMEKQFGKQTLDNLITKKLILEEANKQKITVSDKEISDEITKISDSLKSQNMTLETALSLNGQTMQELQDNVKMNLIAQKMFGSKITVSDQEIQDYFNQNKSSFAENATLASVKDQIKQTLFQNKLSTQFSSWVSDLRKKANIKYFIQ